MSRSNFAKHAVAVTLTLAAVALLSVVANAQSAQLQGIIDGRKGSTMMVKSSDGSTVPVLLSDSTTVQEVEGGLHMRKKQMGMTALIPGLPVQVQGSYNAQNQLVADSVKFKASDLKAAVDAQAGQRPAEEQLAEQQAKMQKEQVQLTAEQQKIAANKAAIAADNK